MNKKYKTKNPVLIKRNENIRRYYLEQKDKYSKFWMIELLSEKYKLRKSTIKRILYNDL